MSQRCDGVTPPAYYLAPLRRPQTDGWTAIAWDMDDHWMTTAEWLAWQRRKGGPRVWDGKRWRYPLRPQVMMRSIWLQSTRKVRKLPPRPRDQKERT